LPSLIVLPLSQRLLKLNPAIQFDAFYITRKLNMPSEFLLELQNLKKYFPVKKGVFGRTVAQLRAVDGVNLSITKGETVGLVGESGCGKTTLGRTVLRIQRPMDGSILFQTNGGAQVDLAKLEGNALRSIRSQIQMIFQDPQSSLNPRMTVLDIIGEPLVANRLAEHDDVVEQVKFLMDKVGLQVKHLNRYPHAFSGGQRQRIGIARALITHPSLVVADEPVSALDVSIRAQVLNLLHELRQEFGLTYLFISHDLSVVEHISDRVIVMYVGKVLKKVQPPICLPVRCIPTQKRFCARSLIQIRESAPTRLSFRVKRQAR